MVNRVLLRKERHMEAFLLNTVLLLLNSWLLQEVVGSNCSDPWNVTLEQKNFTLRWSGADRDADLVVKVLSLQRAAIACPNFEQVVPFSRRVVHTEDLCANTDYTVNLRLLCLGEKYDKDSIPWRLEQELFAPTKLTAVQVTNTSATLAWETPPHPVIHYEVMKSRLEDFNTEDTYQVGATSYLMAGLVAYTRYYAMVRARTEVALGPWTPPLSFLTDVGVPFAPLRIRASEITNSSITVSWEPPSPSTGPVLWYTVSWRAAREEVPARSVQVNGTTHHLTGLLPHTNYFAWLRATTAAGDGAWSNSLDTWTGIGVPSEPRNVTALNVTSTGITVGWEAPDPPNGPLLGYVVSWGARGTTVTQSLVSESPFDALELVPYTQYSFEVAARTEAGLGPSSRLAIRTDIDVPSAPLNLSATDVRNTSALVGWEAPERPNGPLLEYVVRCTPDCNDTTTNDTAALLLRLRPSTHYQVHVVATTGAGEGPPSEPLLFRTELGVPHALENLTVSEVTATRIQIEWFQSDDSPSPTEDVSIAWGVVGTAPSQVSTLEHHYEAVGLRPYTEYYFQIAPRNEAGHGLAHTLSLRTAIAAPSFPRDVIILETTDSSALLQWLSPEHPNGPCLGYSVQWLSSAVHSTNRSNGEDWTNATTFRVENLDHSANYSVRVAANNSAGRGPWSPDSMLTTGASPSGSSLVLGLTLGIVLPLLVIFVLLGLYVAKRKKVFKFLEQRGPRKPPPMQQTNEAPKPLLQLEVIHPISTSMTVHNFEERLKATTRQDFTREFEELRRQSPAKSCTEAKLDANLVKNRWVKMLPFDHSRVKLQPNEGEMRSNFINASYMPGTNHLVEYIATQGPLPNTVDDLWRLVWQQGVPLVVMLTQCVERAVRNCELYWPSAGQGKIYGDVQVQNVSESILTSYVQRTFVLQHLSQKRQVVQMHFTNWPVSGCPRSPDEFLHFARKVREQVSERRPGPILVHCSAGVGRTGTFIALDRLQQSLQDSNDIDVFGTVMDMRRYRPHMVHTEDQYVFIYSCIERLLQERNTQEENIYELLPN